MPFDDNLRIPQVLLPTLCMCQGNFVESASGVYQLEMQADGNLVLYKNRDESTALWASNTPNSGACCCTMQGDGNLVLYGHDWSTPWSSGTNGNNGAWLIVQDDGNVVIYKYGESSPNGAAAWSTGTSGS